MKKIYLLSLICCLSFAAFAQTVVSPPIYAHDGTAGTFVSGSSTATLRTDDSIVSTGTGTGAGDRRGYAVFDLSSIPTDATVVSVTVNFYVANYLGSGMPSTEIRGYDLNNPTTGAATLGDMAFLTTAASLFPEMVATFPTTRSLGITGSWGTGGHVSLPATGFGLSFFESNFGNKVSLVWTGGNSRTYKILGHFIGTATTGSTPHAPYLIVSYCPKPTATAASVAPNPVCPNAVFTLTGTATGTFGASAYSWYGPGMLPYIGISGTHTATASASSAGVYTLVATNTCGTTSNTDTLLTSALTLLASPGPISGPTNVCTGDMITLSDASGATTTTWSTTASPSMATIDAAGVVTAGSTPFPPVATFYLTEPSTGCWVTHNVSVNAPPAAITGALSQVCELSSINLFETSTTGAWVTGDAAVATVTSAGVVTGAAGGAGGVSAGVVDISYVVPACPAAVRTITVNPIPAAIIGLPVICQGYATTISNSTGGGSWISSDVSVATLGTAGDLYGVVTGAITNATSIIHYVLPLTGCENTMTLTVSPQPTIGGPAELCQNELVLYTESTGTGGSWSTNDATIAPITLLSGNVTGGLAGTAIISYSATVGGCFSTKTILVNPIPQPIGGVTNVCEGEVTGLTDIDPGGAWTSSIPANGTVDAITGDVKGILAGYTIITYTLPVTGCYNTTTVTIMAAPVSLISAGGPTTFCLGGSVVLSAPPGYIYQWFRNGATMPGENGISYTATTTDSFTVGITNAAGCYDLSAPMFVSAAVSPVINASGATVFCTGGGVTLTANTGTATGTMYYQWQKNGTNIAAATAVNYFANTTGVYTAVVSITGASGVCMVTSTPQTVNVHPLPVPVISDHGLTYNTTVMPSFVSYQWYLNTVSIPGATSPNVVPSFNGSYRVRVTDTSGCSGYSASITRYVVGVNQVTSADVRIYPNPATAIVHIESPVKVRAIVTGLEGRTLIDNAEVSDLNISGLAKGIYMITLYDSNGTRVLTEKLIKE